MSSVKISVIVPVYNTEKYLNECISSIINQTFEDIEVICIDDGSTDNSLNILKEYAKEDKRISIVHQDNMGISKTRNIGLGLAKGKYVTFIDSDDYFELTALEECYSIAEDQTMDILIFKFLNFDNETGEKIYSKNFEMKHLKDKVGENVFNYRDVIEYFFRISPTTAGKFYRREFVSDLRYVEGLIFEDNPFFIKAFLKADRVYFYDRHLYHRRLRADSITHSFHHAFSDCIEIYEIIAKTIEDNGVYDELKEEVLRNRCKDVFNRFSQVKDEYKVDFFDKIQANFSKIRPRLENDGTLINCDEKTRVIFYSALEADNGSEFELMVNNYKLNVKKEKLEMKVEVLKEKINKIKNENKKLKNENKALKKKTNSILNSKSWKLTAPLRKFKNLK